MAQTLSDQALALTGMLQAAALVDHLATKNSSDGDACETLLHSLFQFNPDTTFEVFGDKPQLDVGKQAAKLLLGSAASRERQALMNYTAGIIRLAKQLQRNTDMVTAIGNRLQHAQRLINDFSDSSINNYSVIAGIYTDTLSTLPFRITVSGEENYLKNRGNADKIRSLLLCGVRCAVLWNQCGGRRRHFILKRNALLHAIQQL